MGITETKYYEDLKQRYEKSQTKAAARKIVKEQTATAISEEVIDCQISRLTQQSTLAEKEDRYAQKQGKINLKKKLSAASLPLLIFSIITALLSVFMSVAGISHVHTPNELLQITRTEYWLPAFLMAAFQITAIIASLLSYGFEAYYRKLNKYITLFRTLIFGASVYSNHMFLCDLIPEYNTSSGLAFGWFFAAGADIMSNLFSTVSISLKHRLYDSNENTFDKQNASYLTKIWLCLTANIRLSIDEAYYKKMSMLNDFYKSNKTTRPKNKDYTKQTKQEKTVVNTDKMDVYDGLDTKKNKNITYYKYLIPDNIDIHEKQLETIPNGSKITKDMFDLDTKQWRQLRDYWVKQGKVKCIQKSTYKTA